MPKDNYSVYKFNLEISGDVAASEGALPIYDDNGLLIGGFTVQTGDLIVGFIAGQGYPLALEVSTGAPIWFHPCQGADGLVSYAIVTLKSKSVASYKINPEQEERP